MTLGPVLFGLIAIAATAMVAALLARRARAGSTAPPESSRPEEEPRRNVFTTSHGQVEIVPSSISEARAARLLPVEGSEEAAAMLRRPTISANWPRERDDYLPDPVGEWSVTIAFPAGTVLRRESILNVLTSDWCKNNLRPEIYGHSPTDGHWTFLRAGGVPEDYDELCLGVRLCEVDEDDPEPLVEKQLKTFLDSVRARCEALGPCNVSSKSSPAEAAARSKRLLALHEECKRDVRIALVALDGVRFDGRVIWDTMLSLGLRWGDMDVFHWQNDTDAAGDDSFFSVWTTTEPGYFFPEEIAAGRCHVDDLIFGFSIPRSAAPAEVFEEMERAARYAQKRLGGELVDEDGAPLEPAAIRREIGRVVQRLAQDGLVPGAESTLRLF